MIELRKWMYSQDIADWRSCQSPLDMKEEMDCILSAPHRNICEKLEGLKELQMQGEGGKELEKRIKNVESLLRNVGWEGRRSRYRYTTELFYHGKSVRLQEKRLFWAPTEAVDFICTRIQGRAEKAGTDSESYFGILHEFHWVSSKYFGNEKDYIVNSAGKIVYCIPGASCRAPEDRIRGFFLQPECGSYLKIPYPSGTIVEIPENPYFTPVKGVLINETEPEEDGFAGERYGQFLLYADSLHVGRGTELGVADLGMECLAFTEGVDFVLPYKQYIRRAKGELSEDELWIEELGRLGRKEKSRLISMIFDDHRPGKRLDKPSSIYEGCMEYVSELADRCSRI